MHVDDLNEVESGCRESVSPLEPPLLAVLRGEFRGSCIEFAKSRTCYSLQRTAPRSPGDEMLA